MSPGASRKTTSTMESAAVSERQEDIQIVNRLRAVEQIMADPPAPIVSKLKKDLEWKDILKIIRRATNN